MHWKTFLLLVFPMFYSVSKAQDSSSPVKYAPNYCLRFRFNCNNEEKKGHVCCLYPLPEANGSGGGGGGSSISAANSQAFRPSSTVQHSTAIKFRPLKLPVTKKEPGTNENENQAPARPSVTQNKGRPKAGQNKKVTTSPAPKVRPRICERLVINCKNSPEHRCCQFEQVMEAVTEQTTQEENEGRDELPISANQVKVKEVPVVVKGEAIPVPLENPVVVEAQKKYEKIINDEVTVGVPADEPYERIPAECFTESFDCDQDPGYKCCAFLE